MIEHLPPLELLGPLTDKATRAASVNASFTPRFRLAEHSIPTVSNNIKYHDYLTYPGISALVYVWQLLDQCHSL